jgi:hypothetical protein
MPTAYSYIRFSQISQSKGGSLERQETTAEEYAEKEGLTLDTKLDLRDMGVSAFKGKNARRGALSEFMEAVESGKVAPGSYLLIEDMDRLTRLPVMQALAVFQRILAGGIVLVTLKNGMKYSEESLAEDWTKLMPVLFDMSRGWGESDRKSDLLTKAWRKKKEAAAAAERKPMGDVAPRWLEYVQDEETKEWCYKPIKKRVEIVNRIFQLALDGYGHGAIATMLNKDGVSPFKRPGADVKDGKRTTWALTSIGTLLANRAVLGEYQPWSIAGSLEKRTKAGPAVPNYFPQIVDLGVFNRVQDAVASRYIHRSTKQTKSFNIWAGVAVCASCGANMTVNTKGKSRIDPDMPLSYLICSNREKGVCEATGVRLDGAEQVFLHILAITGNMSLVAEDVAKQESQLQAARGRLMAEQEALSTYVEDYEATRSRSILALMTRQEQQVSDTNDEIAKLETSLAANTVIDRQSFFDRIDLVSRAGRNQANALLKRLGIKVAISKAGSRSKLAYYSVYQSEKLVMKLTDEAGKISESSYSPDVTMRMYDQRELQDHQLEHNVGFNATKPKPLEPRESTGPNWNSYDDTLPDEAYDLLGEPAEPVFYETPLHAPDD